MNITELITKLPELTEEQAILEIHRFSAIPAVLIISFLAILTMGILGFFVKGEKKKYITLWGAFCVLLIMYVIGVLYLPNIVQIIANLFRS